EALVEAPDDLVLVVVDAGDVDRLESCLDAELGALARRVGDFRGMEERLRRDAPAVEAGAAELVLLDEGHRQTQLAGTQGGGIAATATPEDHDVVGLVVSRLRTPRS